MPVIKDELQRVARLWNSHRIRPSTNLESAPGKRDMLYCLSATAEDAEDANMLLTHVNWLLLSSCAVPEFHTLNLMYCLNT